MKKRSPRVPPSLVWLMLVSQAGIYQQGLCGVNFLLAVRSRLRHRVFTIDLFWLTKSRKLWLKGQGILRH